MSVKPGNSGRRATAKEVAAELGVAPSTVSNAYNRPDQLSPALRERVFETAQRLEYAGPDPVARGLRRRQSGAVGVLYRDRLSYAFADPAAVQFLEGVSAATEEAGLGLLLVPGAPRAQRDAGAVLNAAVDGFVIYCMAKDDPLVGAALARRLPAVLVDQPRRGEIPAVGINDAGAARDAAEHLLELGHRRLAVVSFELSPEPVGGLADSRRQAAATYLPSRSRLSGYAVALEAAGISWEGVPVYECAENLPEEGQAAAEFLLSRAPRPTAILAQSDQLARGVLEAAGRLGFSVPEDLSVVGFDDIPAAAQTDPPLTTVHQSHVEKGRRAGRMLIAQLRGEEPEDSGTLPARLVIRGSTARVAQVGW